MQRALQLSLTLAIAGCFPYYGQPDATDDSDGGANSGELTSTHTGWRDPACWDCHGEDSHNAGLQPAGCVICHGSNGAPGGHTSSTPCSQCHVEPHGADGFPDPDSCQTCHPM